MEQKYECLQLKKQLCFPLYAVSNQIIRKYQSLLDKLNLTYTQYIVMMVLWEEEKVNEKRLGEVLRLKSNTLAPLLKKLAAKGYICKEKSEEDERHLTISLTEAGRELKDRAIGVPAAISKELDLTEEEASVLYRTLYKILDKEGD